MNALSGDETQTSYESKHQRISNTTITQWTADNLMANIYTPLPTGYKPECIDTVPMYPDQSALCTQWETPPLQGTAARPMTERSLFQDLWQAARDGWCKASCDYAACVHTYKVMQLLWQGRPWVLIFAHPLTPYSSSFPLSIFSLKSPLIFPWLSVKCCTLVGGALFCIAWSSKGALIHSQLLLFVLWTYTQSVGIQCMSRDTRKS